MMTLDFSPSLALFLIINNSAKIIQGGLYSIPPRVYPKGKGIKVLHTGQSINHIVILDFHHQPTTK